MRKRQTYSRVHWLRTNLSVIEDFPHPPSPQIVIVTRWSSSMANAGEALGPEIDCGMIGARAFEIASAQDESLWALLSSAMRKRAKGSASSGRRRTIRPSDTACVALRNVSSCDRNRMHRREESQSQSRPLLAIKQLGYSGNGAEGKWGEWSERKRVKDIRVRQERVRLK